MRAAIPSMVTLSSVCCAVLAVVWADTRVYWACNAIIAASLLDMVDGRIARMLDAQSEFGAELDSLADVLAFGFAPAILTYQFVSPGPGVTLWLASAMVFVVCAALRLALFNVRAGSGDAKFSGIPTPVAALLSTTAIMGWHELELGDHVGPSAFVGLQLAAALLMVAPVPFPSFKRFDSKIVQVLYFGSMAGGVAMLFLGLPGGALLFVLLGVYVGRGLVGALLPGGDES